MDKLRCSNRLVNISEPILAEDSTFSTIALSLRAVLEQLSENATHHDYLIALLLVLLAESGFHVLDASDTLPTKWQQNTRLVYIPANWKSHDGVYYIRFILRDVNDVKLKLIGITHGDKVVVNILSPLEDTTYYSTVIQTLRYVNPYTSNLCLRYMNLKEISRRFKDKLITPLRTKMLLFSNVMGPSLESLPMELRMKIASRLSQQALVHLSTCSKRLYEPCAVLLLKRGFC